ncbi:MAG: hypothetical protein WBA87_13725 [Microbacterium sp.]
MSAQGLVPVKEYHDYRSTVRTDEQLWENSGWTVRGADSGTDYLFWASPYFIQGVRGGTYLPGRLALNQTLLITCPIDAPGELTDNDFIAVGWDPVDYLSWDDVTVSGDDDLVEWEFQGRRFTAGPDSWRVDGTHAGVDSSLKISPAAAPMWFTDPGRDIRETGNRWWIANGRAVGELRSGDVSLSVDAHAVHERHIHLGRKHDPVRLLADGGVVWFTISGDDITCAVLARPSLGSAWAQLIIDGRPIEVRNEAISFSTERTWHDPATGMLVGQSWRLSIEHEDGAVDFHIQAKARAYYTWNFLADGATMLYWWLCSAEATLTSPSTGRAARVMTGLPAEAHLNRTFHRRHGSTR